MPAPPHPGRPEAAARGSGGRPGCNPAGRFVSPGPAHRVERGGKDESEPPAYLKPEALVDRLGARRLLPRAVQAQRQARRTSPGPLQPRADPVGPVLAGREGRTGIGGQEPGAEGREAIAHLRSQPAGRGLARGPGRQALRGLPRPQAVHAARGRGAGVWCVMMIAGKVARGGRAAVT